MSNTNDEIEVKVDGDVAPAIEPEVQIVEDRKAPPAHLSADEGIEDLRRRLEEEKAARIEAEKQARLSAEAARRSASEVEDTNLQLVNNAIETIKRDSDFLKAKYRQAMATGDYDAAADAQQIMSVKAAQLLQLENGRDAMKAKPQAQSPSYSDPVEQFASQLSPRSAAWIRRNPQCVTDPRLQQKMIAAHNLAVADGYEADSDDYFSFVEDTLRLNRRDVVQNEPAMSAAATPTQKRTSPPAAPVTRSGTGTGIRSNVVRLSSDEREMASMMGMTEQEYAKNKLQLQREGKLN